MNMLIAMMARTFDNVFDAQELNYQFLLAQTVLTWRTQPTMPPPFNVLRIPYHILKAIAFVASKCVSICSGKSKTRSKNVDSVGPGADDALWAMDLQTASRLSSHFAWAGDNSDVLSLLCTRMSNGHVLCQLR